MSRKSVIIIISLLAATALAAVVAVLVLRQPDNTPVPDDNAPEQPADSIAQPQFIDADSAQTHSIIVFEDEFTADPMMVGKWQNEDNPGWYQVFYDDYDDENFFWGKEWDENDDVMEEDLRYHGNGWFRWRKDGKTLLEVSVQDQHSGDIPHDYTIRLLSDDVLELQEKEARKRIYRFKRAD